MAKDDELLTNVQVRKMLNVSRDSVLRMCKRGDLKSIQLGPKTIRIFKSSVIKLLSEGIKDGK